MTLNRLPELEHVELHRMHALLTVGHILTGFTDFFLLVCELFVEHLQPGPDRFRLLLIGGDAFAQGLDLTLAFEEAMLALVWREEGHAGTGHQVAARRHQSDARRQVGPAGQGDIERVGYQDRAQPVIQDARQRQAVAAHTVAQGIGPGPACRCSSEHYAEMGRGPVVQPFV